MTRERFGGRIQRKRKEKKLGLREAAAKADVSAAYLAHRNEEEKSPPSEKVIRALAELLEDDFDELMTLAGRIPQDVEKVVTSDSAMPQFLREASEKGYTGKELLEMLEKKRKK